MLLIIFFSEFNIYKVLLFNLISKFRLIEFYSHTFLLLVAQAC